MSGEKMYHVSRRPLSDGTTLMVGAFGEKMQLDDYIASNYHTHIKENIFEEVRKLHYPDAPSRFNAVFLFPDFNTAKDFYAQVCGYKNYVFEVEIQEGTPFIVEMNLLKCEGMRYENLKFNAHKYWQQVKHPNSGTLEVILNGKAVVKKTVLSPSVI